LIFSFGLSPQLFNVSLIVFLADMVGLARDVMCMKHALEDQLHTARSEFMALLLASKELPPHLAPVLMYYDRAWKDVSRLFHTTDCTCWEGPETERIGGSWVSDGNDDVANLPDLVFGFLD
jgi:hypothetical protein